MSRTPHFYKPEVSLFIADTCVEQFFVTLGLVVSVTPLLTARFCVAESCSVLSESSGALVFLVTVIVCNTVNLEKLWIFFTTFNTRTAKLTPVVMDTCQNAFEEGYESCSRNYGEDFI